MATSINLATSYSGKIATAFTKASYVAGNYSNDYSFEGVRSLNIWTPKTVDLVDYDRTATADRFGQMTEMEDSLQTLTMNEEKSFSISIDRGNYSDQMMMKRAGRMMNLQIAEKVVPMMDKYTFDAWVNAAGTKAATGALTKANVVGKLLDAGAALDNALVPDDNRVVYLPVRNYNALRQSSEFMNLEALGVKAVKKGEVGNVGNMRIVKVPDSYLPADVEFLLTYKGSLLRPVKLKTARILTEVKDVDGWLLQGRWYYDAFVIKAKEMGVYAGLTAARG